MGLERQLGLHLMQRQAGEVQMGYRFKGGDPADQKNWERVAAP